MMGRINDSYKFFRLFYRIYNTDFNTINDTELDELKELILENGSISIKFMQWYISKLINECEENENYKRVIEKFEDIFDSCPFHTDEETEEIFIENFGSPIYNFIQEGTLERIASGSIGQVYKAKLLDGREVAIKVRHPNVTELKDNQMLFINMVTTLQGYSFFRNNFSLFMDIEDFIFNLNLQLDFKNEVFNNLTFSKQFRHHKKVIIPKVYYYSSDVIISEFCGGLYIDEITNLYSKRKIALNFLCFNLESAVFNNFLHADLHSKNWKVQENNKDSKIIIYDFGLCFTSVSPEKNLKVWEAFTEVNLNEILEEKQYLVQGDSSAITMDKIEDIAKFKDEKFEVNLLMKRLRNIFVENNLRITKLFMNFIVWISLIEEMIKNCDCFCKDVQESDTTLHQQATVIAYCESVGCYDVVKEYYLKKYNQNNLSSIFNEDDTDLVFSDIED
jgi:predicted unusual protein kinase regulating ubiquinone biosynthesis (AarF/ABC1/UbiB family)